MSTKGEAKYLSPNQKAIKRLKKNKSAVAGLVVIVLATLLAIFGNLVAPDHTPNADDQILEISTSKMGFETQMLLRKKDQVKERSFKSIFSGFANPYEMIPITNYEVVGDSVLYTRYTGENRAGKNEALALREVVGENVEGADLGTVVSEKHIKNKRYLLGTDKYGRDNLSRLILGVRISLSVGLLAVTISLFIGILLGALAGFYQKSPPEINLLTLLFFLVATSALLYFVFTGLGKIDSGLMKLGIVLGGLVLIFVLSAFANSKLFNKISTFSIRLPVDDIIMYIINTFWPIPVLLLIFALILALGREFWQIYLAVGLVMWVEVARVVRGQFLSVREKEYVEAAESLGFSDFRTIFRHVLPNTIAPIIVITAANFASAIIIEAGLSFLGIGVKPPMPSWGTMLNEYYGYVGTDKAFLAFLPGLSIMVLVLAFNLLGNGLRDALDVKTRL